MCQLEWLIIITIPQTTLNIILLRLLLRESDEGDRIGTLILNQLLPGSKNIITVNIVIIAIIIILCNHHPHHHLFSLDDRVQ